MNAETGARASFLTSRGTAAAGAVPSRSVAVRAAVLLVLLGAAGGSEAAPLAAGPRGASLAANLSEGRPSPPRRVGKTVKTVPRLKKTDCSFGATAASPPFDPQETIWVDDDVPATGVPYGTWNWDGTQKAAGTRSHVEPPPVTGESHHGFENAWGSNFYVGTTDKLIAWVLIDPCDPPSELMLQWTGARTGYRRAVWGADSIDWGTLGVDRILVGPLPAAGEWMRLEVPASLVGLGGTIVGDLAFVQVDGHVWWDRVGKAATCASPPAEPPSSLPAGRVWMDDQPPAGTSPNGNLAWDTAQKASGAQSHTEPAATGLHFHGFENAWDQGLYVAATDHLVTYVLLDPCDPPREILLRWDDGESKMAFWGADLIDWGTLGSDRIQAGPLPPSGQWTRLDVPAAALRLGGQIVGNMYFAAWDGKAWFDRTGVEPACVPSTAAAPASLPPDTIWSDDAFPPGSNSFGALQWDASQKASGGRSHTEAAVHGFHQHGFQDSWSSPLIPGATDRLVCYVLIDPCDPPAEVMLQWLSDGWEHRAYWGANLLDFGAQATAARVNMGALPASGQWIRLEVPASAVALDGQTVGGMAFTLYGGHAWFDRAGKGTGGGAPALASLALNPSSVVAGTAATGTVTLTGAAPAGGTGVAVSSSDVSVAGVPATVVVPAGAASADFTISTAAAGTVTITATAGSNTQTAPLTVTAAPPGLVSLTVSPGSVAGGGAATGTATLTFAAPAGGASVTLSSSNPSAASVPGAVVILEGATSADFVITTSVVVTTTTVSVTGAYSSTQRSGSLIVTTPPPMISALSLSPAGVVGPGLSTGTVTLNAVAPAGGAAVSVTSSNPSLASVPATVTVPAGSAATSFSISTVAVFSSATSVITARTGAATQTAVLTVNPCVASTAPAPSSFPPDTIWSDDDQPAGTDLYGAWTWDPTQRASGTLSHTDGAAAGFHFHGFQNAWAQNFYVAPTDRLVTYVLLDPCNPPRELMLRWDDGTPHMAFWGADLIGWGTLGADRIAMGALPTAGEWTRLEVPASALNLGGQVVGNMYFALFDGQAWFDRTGKTAACAVPVAATPAADPAETIWVDDDVPVGASPYLIWNWDTTQKASGTRSHVEPAAPGEHHHGFQNAAALNLHTSTGERLMAWVLIDPCDPPSELMIQWNGGGRSYRAFWGADSIFWGTLGIDRTRVGALPAPGEWARLEVRAEDLGIQDVRIDEIAFVQNGGHVWWDRIGRISGGARPALTNLTVSPAAVVGGNTAAATVTLAGPAPQGGAAVTVSSSNPSVATTPGTVFLPESSTSAGFPVTTTSVTVDQTVTLTASYAGSSRVTSLLVQAPTACTPPLAATPPGDPGETIWVDDDVPAGTTPYLIWNWDTSQKASGARSHVEPAAPGEHHHGFQNAQAFNYRVNSGDKLIAWVLLDPCDPPDEVMLQWNGGGRSYRAFWGADSIPWGTLGVDRTSVGPLPLLGQWARLEVLADDLAIQGVRIDEIAFIQLGGHVWWDRIGRTGAGGQPALSTLTISSTAVPGGTSVAATVTLTSPASSGGVSVTVSTSNPSAASAPATVLVPEGSINAGFSLSTSAVPEDQAVTVSAAYGGLTRTAPLLVQAPSTVARLSSLSIAPATVVGGAPSSGNVTLTVAPAADTVVALGASAPYLASVPATVTVPAGTTSASFPVTTYQTDTTRSVSISATLGVVQRSAFLSVSIGPIRSLVPGPTPPTIVPGSQGITLGYTVTLALPASEGGATVALATSGPYMSIDSPTVVVPAGQNWARFWVVYRDVTVPTVAVISATYNGYTRSYALSLDPIQVKSFVLREAAVAGGQSTTGLMYLNGRAAVDVVLSSSNPSAASVPATVRTGFQFGPSNLEIPIATHPVPVDTPATISVSYGGVTKSGTLTVRGSAPVLTSFSITPLSTAGAATGTLALSFAPPTGTLSVALAASLPGAAFPAAVDFPAGTATVSFPVTVADLSVFRNTVLTANYAGVSKQAMVTRIVPHIVTPVAEGQTFTYGGGKPAVFAGWAETLNEQALDYWLFPFDNADATAAIQPTGSRMTFIPAGSQVRFVAAVSGGPQPRVLNALDACAGTIPGSCAWTLINLTAERRCPGPDPSATIFPTISGLTNFTTGSPPSLRASYPLDGSGSEFRWSLEREDPTGSGVYRSLSIAQDPGLAGDGYSYENRNWVPRLTGPAEIGPGHHRLQVMAGTLDGRYPGCFYRNGYSPVSYFDVLPAGPSVKGVAPGAVLPGDSNLVLYGDGFDATTAVELAGPVYRSGDSTPLCNLQAGQCPTALLAASFGTGGTLAFAVPSGTGTGAYWVRSRSGVTLSGNGAWLKVDDAQKSSGPIAPGQHGTAPRIYSGQTVNGTFVAGGDTTGVFADYNAFYFFATAGSTVNLSLQRADTSRSWEDPESLDPQLEIVAPDGLVYANLRKVDDQPGVDLNATVTGSTLPLTGLYIVRAETTKGSGPYRLSFSMGSVAPAPAAARAIAFSGNFSTAEVGTTISPTALFVDPRGYTVSGAAAAFSVLYDGQSAVQFISPTTAVTSVNGAASVDIQMTGLGTAQLNAELTSPVLAQWAVAREIASRSSVIPSYAPVAVVPIQLLGMTSNGSLRLVEGSRETLPTWQPAPRAEERGARSSGGKFAAAKGYRPAASEEVRPIPQSLGAMRALSTQAIVSCANAMFVETGTSRVNPPYTVTLTDKTPSTGQATENGVVDVQGIHGHRIDKTIRLKIDIQDGSGGSSRVPVLVHLALGGPHHGTLILDPDGRRIECDQASFVWHETDQRGQIIALNEEVEYRLGTFAPYVGAIPDPGRPGEVKPVWGTAEVLGLTLSTVDRSGVEKQLVMSYKVHPEPGKPDHFSSASKVLGGPPDPVFQFWADAFVSHPQGTRSDGQPKQVTDPIVETNAYYLMDRFENIEFGYTNTTPAATPPAGNVNVSFFDQTGGVAPTGFSIAEYSGYGLMLVWNNDPAMPSGAMTSTVSVTFANDPDWSAGTVSKTVPLQFDRGMFHSVIGIVEQYDGSFYSPNIWQNYVEDPDFPIVVSPGASGAGIPRVTAPTAEAFRDQPARAAFLILNNDTGPIYDRPGPGPGTGQETWAELSDSPAFKVSLIDEKLKVVKDVQFKVHLCPRFDHFRPPSLGRSCELAPVTSIDGVVGSVRVNPRGAGADDSRAYMGIELVTAPANPGTYAIKFETLEGKPYRIRELSQYITDYSAGGEYQGAFRFVTVIGAEILSENFRPADQLIYVGSPKQYYVRYAGIPGQVLPTSATVDTKNEDGTVAGTIPSVPLTRVGSSSYAISGPFTLDPPVGGMSIRRASVRQAAAAELNAGSGMGKLEATVATQTAGRDTQPEVVVELTVKDDKGVMVPRDVQRQTGYLICPNTDDDDFDNLPDYVKRSFPARSQGSVYIREREDTVQVTVTKTARPSESSQLMLRGSISGDSFVNIYDAETGVLLQLPFQVPWDKITNRSLSYFAETAGTQSKPVQLKLSLDNGPVVPPDKAMFHGCDGSYFFISGAGHNDSETHYITGFSHAFQHQKLCGFTDLDVSRGGVFGANDLNITRALFPAGLAGVSSSDPAYQTVQDVLTATATARAAGRAVLVGYSFGASVTAAAAVEAARTGSPFSACAIIGAPISDALLAAYRSACGLSLVKDIPGDAIRAGSTSLWDTSWDFYIQWRRDHSTAPHFFYAQDINEIELQHRRDSLIQEWEAGGALSGQCPASQ